MTSIKTCSNAAFLKILFVPIKKRSMCKRLRLIISKVHFCTNNTKLLNKKKKKCN